MAAICAAPMILGKRGLLQGKHAVCYPGFEKDLLGAVIEQRGVVTDQAIITAKGAGYATEFSLALIRATAKAVREAITP